MKQSKKIRLLTSHLEGLTEHPCDALNLLLQDLLDRCPHPGDFLLQDSPRLLPTPWGFPPTGLSQIAAHTLGISSYRNLPDRCPHPGEHWPPVSEGGLWKAPSRLSPAPACRLSRSSAVRERCRGQPLHLQGGTDARKDPWSLQDTLLFFL